MTVRDGTNRAGRYITFHQTACRMFRQQMCLLKGKDSGVYYYTGCEISIEAIRKVSFTTGVKNETFLEAHPG